MQLGTAAYGVVPFENSSFGPVNHSLDLLADIPGEFRDIQICGETYLDIDHYLVGYGYGKPHASSVSDDSTSTQDTPKGPRPRTQPLKDISHIKRVYSHPQALGQCQRFTSTYLKGAELQEASSTSKAAEIVAESQDITLAAIASKTAVEVHVLTILARGIQDRDDNQTRFFIFQHASHQQLPVDATTNIPAFLYNPLWRRPQQATWKSLVAFTIDHRRTGALADALNVFKALNLNLTSINSRPSQQRAWHYVFFVEFEGESEAESVDLRDLRSCTEWLKWYGSWRDGNKPV